jgi:hypothetical protein
MAGSSKCSHAHRRDDSHRHDWDEHGDGARVVIEMGGSNLVIRSTDNIDHSYTIALADAVNAAIDTDHVVVIDPAPIRCDDEFTAARFEPTTTAPSSSSSRAVAVEVVRSGIIRIPGLRSVWTIDLAAGKFCQSDENIDIHFLDDHAWTPVIAIGVTPTRLIALGHDGRQFSAPRARHELVEDRHTAPTP